MTYSEEIKKIRQKCFLSQEAFGRARGFVFFYQSLGVRQKQTKYVCHEKHNLDFSALEELWMQIGKET